MNYRLFISIRRSNQGKCSSHLSHIGSLLYAIPGESKLLDEGQKAPVGRTDNRMRVSRMLVWRTNHFLAGDTLF